MLTRAPRAVRINLAVVLTFAVLAVLLLTRTLVSATRIEHDVEAAVNPPLAAIGTDTLNLPALDRTRELADAIAAAAAPLHPSLAESGRLNAEVAATLRGIRDDTLGIGRSVSAIDISVTDIRASLGDLTPVVAGIRTRTGEVRGNLHAVADGSRGLATAVAGLEAALAGTERAVRLTAADVHRVRATLRAVGVHTANIDDSALLRLADLLLRRPDLLQAGDITAS